MIGCRWWVIIIAEFPKGASKPGLRERCIEWVRKAYAEIKPYRAKDEGRQEDYWTEVLGDTYGANLPRLQALKHKYDRGNFFAKNRNFQPAAPVSPEANIQPAAAAVAPGI